MDIQKRDLGRYAYENKMPDWLYRLLEDEEKKHLEDAPQAISGILGKLLEYDHGVEVAYLCHPAVRYIGKVKVKGKDEGDNFCGYHNIQMLIDYINAAKLQGREKLAGDTPTIRDIQIMIEEAWDQGFNQSSRVQTGGIKGTRKHIGTPEVCTCIPTPHCCRNFWRCLRAAVRSEYFGLNRNLTTAQAQALFRSLGLPYKVERFQDIAKGAKAYEQLLDSVEQYFSTSTTISEPRMCRKVQVTALSPVYLQRPHHSMTIIGIEKQENGSRSLLVFDPAYYPSRSMMRTVSANGNFGQSESLLKPYRRGKKYLTRFAAFETLRLAPEARP